MRYISHYEEYPIYEPAEGGYYYPGNQLVASKRKSKRQCRKDFEKSGRNVWKRTKTIQNILGLEKMQIIFSEMVNILVKVKVMRLNISREVWNLDMNHIAKI